MSDPRYINFWSTEYDLMVEEVGPLVSMSLLAGIEGGARDLPDELSTLVNYDQLSEEALAFMALYDQNTLGGINDSTRRRVMKEISLWIPTDRGMKDLMRRLDFHTYPNHRARTIAVTEVTRLFAYGNMLTWNATPYVTGKRWQTARDERVCRICGPLHDQVVEIDAPYAGLQYSGDTITGFFDIDMPPAHPNCRCWLLPFVDEGEVLAELEMILG